MFWRWASPPVGSYVGTEGSQAPAPPAPVGNSPSPSAAPVPRREDIVNIIPWVVVYLVAYSKGLSFEGKIALFTFYRSSEEMLSYLCAKPYYEKMH